MRSEDYLESRESEQPKKGRRNWKSVADRDALIKECRAFVEENGRFPSQMAPKGSRERYLYKSVSNGLDKGLFTEREKASLEKMRPLRRFTINVTREEAVKIKALAAEQGISVHELLHEIVFQHIELIREEEQELQ